MIAFADDPTTYASFDALLVPARRRPAKKRSAAAEPPKTAPESPVTETANAPAASSIGEAPTASP